MTHDEALRFAGDELAEAQVELLMEYAERLSEQGKQPDDIVASLQRYCHTLNQWRATALARIGRRIDEPDAPSHELQ